MRYSILVGLLGTVLSAQTVHRLPMERTPEARFAHWKLLPSYKPLTSPVTWRLPLIPSLPELPDLQREFPAPASKACSIPLTNVPMQKLPMMPHPLVPQGQYFIKEVEPPAPPCKR